MHVDVEYAFKAHEAMNAWCLLWLHVETWACSRIARERIVARTGNASWEGGRPRDDLII